MNDRKTPQVVIIGGGFGGLYCAKALKKAPVRVTVIDRRNFHLFQPLLYQVATSSLSPSDISHPIRAVLRKHANTEVWMAEVTRIDVDKKQVVLEDGIVPYDYLVLATGATHAYFGHDDWAEVAPGLKTVDDATELRRRFLHAFEEAEREADPVARLRQLTFVIIGGGATGVELAGAMAEIARKSIPKDFRAIDTASARIILLEGGPRVLPAYPEVLSAKAQRHLEKLGVEVRTNALVTNVEGNGVNIGDEHIPAHNVFWAAGVAASPVGQTLGAKLDRAGRVLVNEDCTIPDHPEVFVVGDLAHFVQDGHMLPGVCQVAMQMGKHAARSITSDLRGAPRNRFRYLDKGNMATIGRAAAVADIRGLKFGGLLAWLIWVFIHILYLIGFRNRILVMIQWAWQYVGQRRSNRLITGDVEMHLTKPRTVGV
ncbi:MAG TPA: NAD(P)/FAD-dependent oxidoreductase [Longimicrobiales bacterium]